MESYRDVILLLLVIVTTSAAFMVNSDSQDVEVNDLETINVTERSRMLLWDVRLRGGLKVRCYSVIVLKQRVLFNIK